MAKQNFTRKKPESNAGTIPLFTRGFDEGSNNYLHNKSISDAVYLFTFTKKCFSPCTIKSEENKNAKNIIKDNYKKTKLL